MSEFSFSVREPKIELYEDGFEGICKLGRATYGRKLSKLVDTIDQPMVIAVDAPWGAGKSVFLKCWVGAHSKENDGFANTVYFDAFKNDFMDEPLIGLTAAVGERLLTKGDKSAWEKAKQAAAKLAKPALKVGISLASAGLMEAGSAIVDAGLETGSKELEKASEAFWKKEDGKRSAMEAFRDALMELTRERTLVIVVDELDRCRPDYALNLLEVIKHFFDVDNVHFVLGINLGAMANSVRARYGHQADGERYLQKFITLSMNLSGKEMRGIPNQSQIMHFENVADQIGLSASWKSGWIKAYLEIVDHHARLSLRDVEKIVTLAMVSPEPSEKPPAKIHFYIGALILSILAPQVLEMARRQELTAEALFSVLNLRMRPENSSNSDAHEIWSLLVAREGRSLPVYLGEAKATHFGQHDPRGLLRTVIAETIDVFRPIL